VPARNSLLFCFFLLHSSSRLKSAGLFEASGGSVYLKHQEAVFKKPAETKKLAPSDTAGFRKKSAEFGENRRKSI
jgi:hypothetical protein